MREIMESQTTTEEINEKVRNKDGSLFDKVMKAAMNNQNIPKCDVCLGMLVSGNIIWSNSKGKPLTICTKCMVTAITYWMNKEHQELIR